MGIHTLRREFYSSAISRRRVAVLHLDCVPLSVPRSANIFEIGQTVSDTCHLRTRHDGMPAPSPRNEIVFVHEVVVMRTRLLGLERFFSDEKHPGDNILDATSNFALAFVTVLMSISTLRI